MMIPKKMKDVSWMIQGPFDSSYSLAIVNRELAREMKSRVNLLIKDNLKQNPNQAFLGENTDIYELYLKSVDVISSDVDVCSLNTWPPKVNNMRAFVNMLHCYGWEETSFPKVYLDEFNKYLQCITVTSNYVKRVLIDNGCTVPIFVSGNGVDHWERIIPKETFVPGKEFKFIHISSCFPRKGIESLIEAFCMAFNANDNVSLVVKTFANPHNNTEEILKEIKSKYTNHPDIIIVNKDLPDSELKYLLEHCDVLVAPSKCEGFGLPFAEAMISRIPVITTGWSGQLDFCTEENSYLVDYHFSYAKTHMNLFDSIWAEPNIESLKNAMIESYNASNHERSHKANIGRKLLLKDFTWKKVAERNINAVSKLGLASSIPDPKIGWMTTWNVKCGIASYSEYLINEFKVEPIIFASKEESLSQDMSNVHRCWSRTNEENFSELEQKIDALGVDSLVVQFHFAFYNLRNFNNFIMRIAQKGINIFIVMHATASPNEYISIDYIRDALLNAKRVIVHSVSDMNRLKDIGITENTVIIPHGILQYETVKSSCGKYTIASYGFAMPHKGLVELMQAFKLIHDKKPDSRLIMCNAEYPNSSSRKFVDSLTVLRKDLKLEDAIILNNQYLQENESLEILSKANLIVYPYQFTGESSSAAVRFGLATGKTVAVTPLSIFDDVSPAVHYLEGTSPEQIASGILHLFDEQDNMSTDYINKQKEAARWRESHNFKIISERLYNMIYALHQDSFFSE